MTEHDITGTEAGPAEDATESTEQSSEHSETSQGGAGGEGAAEVVTAESLGIELPDDADTATAMLLGEVARARADAADYLDQLQRKAAEFDNYRKRTLRETALVRELGAERLVSALLPVLDSFDAALALPAESENEKRLLAGMSGTYDQLVDALSREGFSAVPGVGAPFDPSVHEAVSSPPDATGALVVAHELRRGYRLKEKLLRAALVALGESTGEPDQDESQVGSET